MQKISLIIVLLTTTSLALLFAAIEMGLNSKSIPTLLILGIALSINLAATIYDINKR